MKKSIVFLFMAFGLLVRGQGFQESQQPDSGTVGQSVSTSEEGNGLSESERFETATAARKIPQRTFYHAIDAKKGYYAIAGVFKSDEKLDKQVRKLAKKGFAAGYFLNPKNKLHYLYLNHYLSFSPAIAAIDSKFGDKYQDDVWILRIQEGKVEESWAPEPRETKEEAPVVSAPESKIAVPAQKAGVPTGSQFPSIAEIVGTEGPAAEGGAEDANGLMGAPTSEPAIPRDLSPRAGSLKERGATTSKKVVGDQENALLKQDTFSSFKVLPSDGLAIADKEPVAPSANDAQNRMESNMATMGVPKNILPKNSLLKRADEYFNKMWYAEAAILYEEALEQNPDKRSFEVLKRAGDSHYYNTNMKEAFKWYDLMYQAYEDEFTANDLFKYAHALKGNKKYARSKRLMRLYHKKMRKADALGGEDQFNLQQEQTLDNILNSTREVSLNNITENSEYSDFSPMYYGEDKVVFASAMDSSFLTTRRYKWDNQPYLDLYVAELNKESLELRNATKFSKEINTKYHEASVTFTPDGKTMFFTRNNYGKKLRRDKNGINHLKIYKSLKEGEKWTEAVEVPFNSDEYSTGHPVLSEDGKKMYFVSDMPGTMGETDIFVVDLLEDGSFSQPKNLGPEVNTEQKEMFPFIAGAKLYFASNGHPGLGGLDVFVSEISDEAGFGAPRNLGQPINSNQDDFSYIVDKASETGFFASNRDGGKGRDDIYSFKNLAPEEVKDVNSAIAGIVTDRVTGAFLPKALVELLDENNVKLKEMETQDGGNFIFEDLDADTKYTLRTNKDPYTEDVREVVTVENDTVLEDIALKKLQDMIAVQDGIKKLKTEMIHFDFDKSYIRPDAALELDKLVEVMKENPSLVIKVESHTDSRGSKVYNRYLSDKRAKSTRQYIISKGIAPERIESAIGYGEDRLLNECDGTVRCTEEKHYLNRRSEFIIVKM
ncbi:OmpA family protein [Maribacter sp. 2307ULW6-5]|uniref:OmpA family protein n=1 Tax=Maribacter sp. 2307ULW6-5 TaxID=3386275 RepID=UPI0039BD7BC7